MMFYSILVTTSSGSSSQGKEAVVYYKVYCIGTCSDESERTGCMIGQVMVVVVTGTGWSFGLLAVMGNKLKV